MSEYTFTCSKHSPDCKEVLVIKGTTYKTHLAAERAVFRKGWARNKLELGSYFCPGCELIIRQCLFELTAESLYEQEKKIKEAETDE